MSFQWEKRSWLLLWENVFHIFASWTSLWAYEADRSLFRHCQTLDDVASVTLAPRGSPQLCAAATGDIQIPLGPHPSSSWLLLSSQALAWEVGNSVLSTYIKRPWFSSHCSSRMEHRTYPGHVPQNLCGTNPWTSTGHRALFIYYPPYELSFHSALGGWKLGGLATEIISQFWRPEVQDQSVDRVDSFWGIICSRTASWFLVVCWPFFGVLWFVETSPQPLPSRELLRVCVCVSLSQFLWLERQSHWINGPPYSS